MYVCRNAQCLKCLSYTSDYRRRIFRAPKVATNSTRCYPYFHGHSHIDTSIVGPVLAYWLLQHDPNPQNQPFLPTYMRQVNRSISVNPLLMLSGTWDSSIRSKRIRRVKLGSSSSMRKGKRLGHLQHREMRMYRASQASL